MQKSKLIRLLSLFSELEMLRLSAFLKSPYFNTNQHLTLMLEYLQPFHPNFQHPGLNIQQAYQFIFKRAQASADSKETIAKISSKLLKLTEQFIEHQELKEHTFYAAYFRKKWYRKRHKPEWEEDALRNMQVAQSKYPLKDEYKAHCEYLIEYERAKWIASSDMVAEKFDLSKLNETLDAYYLRAKLECLCHMTNHTLVAGQPYVMEEKTLANQLLEIHRERLSPATLIWEKAWLLLQQPSSRPQYLALKQSLLEQGKFLSIPENQTIFSYLSHSARLTFVQSKDYFEELMDLYQWRINMGCLLIDGYVSPHTFFNIITVAVRLHKIDWANNFFQQFEMKLDPGAEKSPDMRMLCNSILHFEKHQYSTALDLLNNAHFKDIQSKLLERRLRLRIYLELGYEDIFVDHTNTFRKFLSVNKSIIPEHHYTGNKSFIQAASLIFKAQKDPKKSMRALAQFVETNPTLPEKHWIDSHLQNLSAKG